MQLTLLGMGPGNAGCLTAEAQTALGTADCLIGSPSLLAAFGKRSDLKKRIEQIDRQIVEPEKERMIGKLSEYILRNEF